VSGGPVGPLARWAPTSNAKVCHTTYTVNRGTVGWMGKKGARDKVTNRRRGKQGVEQKMGRLL